MAVIVNLQFSIQPGKRDQAVLFLDKILPDTRSYDGCQWLHSTTSIEDVNKWEFFSLWESKEKYDTYLQWRMDSGVMEESTEFLAGEPVWRFFNVENSYKHRSFVKVF